MIGAGEDEAEGEGEGEGEQEKRLLHMPCPIWDPFPWMQHSPPTTA